MPPVIAIAAGTSSQDFNQAIKQAVEENGLERYLNSIARAIGHVQDAADCFQETILHLNEAHKQGKPIFDLFAQAAAFLRNKGRQVNRSNCRSVALQIDPETNPQKAVDAKEIIEAALVGLGDGARRAVELMREGYNQSDVARNLDCHEGTISRWIKKVREAVKRLLE